MNSLLEELNCRNSLYHSGIWRIGVSEAVVVTWNYHGCTGCFMPVLSQKLKSGKSRKETADVGNSRFRTLQFHLKRLWREGSQIHSLSFHSGNLYRNCQFNRVVGFKPPTKALNVTAALAVMSLSC